MRFKWKCDKLSQFSKLIEEMAKVKPGWGANIISLLPPSKLMSSIKSQSPPRQQLKSTYIVGLATNFINATGTNKHAFGTQNSPNMFGTYKTQRNRSD